MSYTSKHQHLSQPATVHAMGKLLLPPRMMIILAVLLFSASLAQAQIVSTSSGGNWNNTGTWVGNTVPGNGDDVVIANGATVTLNTTTATLNNVTVGQGSSGKLVFGNSTTPRTMTVSGNFTIASGGNVYGRTNSTANHLLYIGGNFTNNGTFTTTNQGKIRTTFNGAGTQTIGGAGVTFTYLTINNASSITTLGVNTTATTFILTTGIFDPGTYMFTCTTPTFSAGTLRVGGATWGSNYSRAITQPAGGIIEYDAAGPQTVNSIAYPGHLVISGSGTKTYTLTTGRVIAGTLTVNSGAEFVTAGDYTLGVTGATTVSGTLTMGGTSAKTFTGNVTIDSGGAWSETASAAFNFAGNLQYDGSSFSANAGTHTFSGTGKTISGSGAITIPNVAVSGTCTNGITLSVGSGLSGAGTLTNGNGSTGTLNIQGTCSITNLTNAGTATITNAGAISTATAKFINTGTLNLNGSGTIAGITNNAGGIINLASSNTISALNNATATSTLNISAATVPTITNLTATITGNTVNYTGGAQTACKVTTYSNLTLSNSGSKSFSGAITIGATLTISGSAQAGLAAGSTSTANNMNLGGEGVINGTWGSSVATSATYHNDTYFTASTGKVTVTVSTCSSAPAAPVSGGNQTICSGAAIPDLTVSVGSGETADWYSAATGGTLLQSGSTNYTSSGAGTYYAETRNSTTNCVSASRTAVTLTIQSAVTAGAIAADQLICYGTAPALLTSATAGTGSGTITYEWQTNASGSYVTIGSATAATYQPPSLTETTSYQRRTVSTLNGNICYSGYTTPVTVTVEAAQVSPTLSSASPASGSIICAGYNSGTATFGSGSGAGSDEYQFSIDGGNNWSTYVNGAAITTTGGTTSVQVRARRTGGSCSAPAYNTYTIWTFGTTPVTPALSSAIPVSGSAVCTDYNTGTVTGNGGSGGSTGAAGEYQVSIDGGSTWNPYTSGTAITSTGATGNIVVQARRTGGSYGCSTTAWSPICFWTLGTAVVGPTLNAATPASGTIICAGYNTSATIVAGSGGSTDAADLYQYSINGGTTWFTYVSGTSINTGGASTSVQIRVSRSAGSYGCTAAAPAIIATWPVSAATANPSLNTASPGNGITICEGYSPNATINPGTGGSDGAADLYQYSINNGGAWSAYTSGDPIATTGATGNVLIRVSRSAGSYGCSATVPTTIVTWPVSTATVNPLLNVATPANGIAICEGYNGPNATITAGTGGSSGAADLYEKSIDNGVNWSAYSAGSAINTAGATGSVQIRVSRSAGSYGCSATGPTTIVTWPLAVSPVSPTLGTASPLNNSIICAGFSTGTVTGTGGSGGSAGAVNEYQLSINGGGAYSPYTSGDVINTAGATGSVIVQARRTGGSTGCTSTAWNTICTWTVSPATVNPTLNVATPANGISICPGYNVSATITAGSGGSEGAADLYQYSTNDGGAWLAYTSGSTINTSGATGHVLIRASRSAGTYGCTATGPVTIVSWPVSSATVSPTLGTASPIDGSLICTGMNTGTVTGTGGSGGSTGATNEYQVSINGGSSYTSYTSGTAINTSSATGSVIVQARRTGGSYGCSSTGWATICTWTVNPQPTITLGTSPSINTGTSVANLTYSATTGSPTQYSVDYNAAANTAGFIDVADATLGASPIVLSVPTSVEAVYNGTLTVQNADGCVSTGYPISITVTHGLVTASFVTSSRASIYETGTLTVAVLLSATSASTVTVPFTINGSGTATGGGTDYTITASPITIAAGQRTGAINITITSDVSDESDETVIINMGNPTNAIQGAIITHTATITDDDPYPTGSIAVNREDVSTAAEDLVNNVLLNGCLTASTITYTGNGDQIGHFTSGSSSFPISEGIILSTGNVANAEGPNKDFGTTTQLGGAGDTDINTITGGTSYDAAVLEFDFVPEGNTIQFDYIFASEEYAEFVGQSYNDAFAFLLSGPGITGTKNIALIPSTSTAVSINNIHGQGNTYVTNYPGELYALVASNPSAFGPTWTQVPDDANGYFGTPGSRYYYRITPTNSGTGPVNASYYVDNGQFIDHDVIASNGRRQIQYLNQSGQSGTSEMEFDGRTTLLTASHAVTACETYHIKIVIADVFDSKWDSGVFLAAKSFTSNEVQISSHIGEILGDASNMYEGCDGSYIRFQRAEGADNSEVFTFPIIISGTATNGVDYIFTDEFGTIIGDGTFPSSATIGIGVDFVDYFYKAQSDGSIEGNEAIIFRVSNGCPCDPEPTYLEKTVTIVDVPQIQASTVSVIQCVSAGNPVATITVNMQGGLDPNDYQFSLDGGDFQASNVFVITSSLPDGSDIVGTYHDIEVKDQYSCNSITENNIAIPAIAEFEASAGSDNTICQGQSGIQLSASGGIYYTWTSSPAGATSYLSSTTVSNPTISNTIPAGVYTFTVTAQNQLGADPACQGTDDMILTVMEKPVIDVTTDYTAGCNGSSIHLNAAVTNGGVSPTYLWNPTTDLSSSTIGNPVYTPVVSAFQAQFFTVSVTGTNGCSASANSPGINVYPSPVITTGTIVDAACAASNGEATVSGSSPGTTPAPSFNYLWDAAAGAQPTATATGLAAGTYTVTVTDAAHGCSNTKQVTVGSALDITNPVAICQPVTVNLDANGNGSVTPQEVNNNSTDNCTASGSLILSLDKTTFNTGDVGTNTVVLTVEDASGNTDQCSATITVIYSATCNISGSTTIWLEDFESYADGVTDDTDGIPNDWTTSVNSADFSVLGNQMKAENNTAGQYWESESIAIGDWTNLNISVDANEADFLESTDDIRFEYSIYSSGAWGSWIQFINNGYRNDDFTSITACTNVTDADVLRIRVTIKSGSNEEIFFDNVHLTGDPDITINTVPTDVTCNGLNNGMITVNASGPFTPYQYKLDAIYTTYQSSNVFNNLPPGTYTATVKGTHSTISIVKAGTPVTITQPAADAAFTTGLAVTDVAACNPAGGNAIFTITSAQNGVLYELKTYPGGASLSPAVTGTGTGGNLNLTILQANVPASSATYKVVATSSSGCTNNQDVTDHHPTLTVTTSTTPTGSASQSFCSSITPKVSHLAATGTGIVWYNAASGGSVVPGTTNLVNGTKYYASQTINGCESPSRLEVTATVYATPTILSVTHGVICGSGTVIIHATASVGTVNWHSAQTLGSLLGTGNDFTTPDISSTTSYWVDGINNGCTTSTRSEVIATVYPLPTITLSAIPSVCFGDATASLGYGATTGGANQYSITFDAAAIEAGFANVGFTVLPPSQISIAIPVGTPAGAYGADVKVKNSATGCLSDNYQISFGINLATGILSQSTGGHTTCIGGSFSPITVTATGIGLTYQWFSNTSASNSGGTSLGAGNGAQTNSYTPQASVAGTLYYYCTVTGTCGPAATSTVSGAFIVDPATTASISGGSSPICYNTSPGTLTATGGGGNGTYSYLWYKNGISTGNTNQDYSPGALTANASFYCAITSGSCTAVNSNTITITVYGNLSADISGGSSPICYNTAPGTLLATGSGGTGSYTYQWYTTTGVISGATNSTYEPGFLTSTTGFYCAVTSGSCGTVNTPTTTIIVLGELTADISGGSSPICYNTSPEILTATGSGGTGSYTYLWFKDGSTTGVTTQTYNPGNLTSTSTFYCAITSGSCGTANTSDAVITVYDEFTTGISGGTSPVCYGTAPGIFTATGTGGTGAYTYLWYKDGISTGVTTQTYAPGNLTANSLFYCAVTSGTCGTVNTPTTEITVYGNLTAGITGGNSPICYSTAPGTLTATGGGGTGSYTYLWYKDDISTGVTTSTFAPGSLTATSTFYCAITSGSCGTVDSNPITIIVYGDLTAGISGGTSSICYNSDPGTLTATGGGGTGSYTYLWYKNGSTTGITTQTYEPGNLTSTSTFYCAITSGLCGTVNTSTTTITVYGDLTAGISGGTSPICYNTSPGIFTATGGGGTGSYTYLWYKDGSSTGQTDQTYSPGNLTANSSFYCAITSGLCGTVNTSTTVITVYVDLTAGISGGTTPICYNTSPGTFTATGGGGTGSYTYQWYTTTGEISGATSATYNPGNITSGTGYYCAITSGSCGTVNTSTTSIIVYEELTVVISGGTTPVCYNTDPGTLTATGGGGIGTYTYLWYKDGSTTGITTQTYDPGTLTATSAFYCAITSGSCGPVNSAPKTIVVTPLPDATITYPGSPFCTSLTEDQPVDRTGTAGGTYSSTGGLTIDANTGAVTPSTSIGGTYTVTYTVAAFGGCNLFSTTAEVIIVHDLVWTGDVDTDWNTPGNWACLVVPDLTTNVLIPDVTNQPILSTGDIGMSKDLVINSGSSLTITGNTLQIAGAISNSGTFTSSAGTIEMIGTGAQNIPAGTFDDNTIMNLTISNSSDVTLLGTLNITGILKAATGDLYTGDYLTLTSSATQTALIDGSGAGQVYERVTMQRYLPVAFGYKYFSSPFEAATVGQFGDHMDLNATFPTFYRYNENQLDGEGYDVVGGWVAYTNPLDALVPMTGYAVNFGPVPSVQTVDLTDVVNNGNQGIVVTSHDRTYTQGFNLVGNPYPSPIDWRLVDLGESDIDNAIYFFNASSPRVVTEENADYQYLGVYSSSVNGIETGEAGPVIPSMQGFLVHVNAVGNNSLNFTNSMRTNDLAPLFKTTPFDDRSILRFSAIFDSGDAGEDVAVIYFEDYNTQSYDREKDALKMLNTDPGVPSLYSFSLESKQLSINGLPILTDSITEIPLGLNTLNTGWITFRAKDISLLPSYLRIYLLDAEKGILQDLQQYPEYRINLKAGTYNQRFSLVFSLIEVTDPATITKNLFKVLKTADRLLVRVTLPYNTRGTLLVTGMSGQVVLRREVFGSETVQIDPSVMAGLYVVTVMSGNRIQSEKLLMRLNYE